MTPSPAEGAPSTDMLLGEIAEEFFERIARGESPQVEEYAREYPQIAEMIRDVFPALDLVKDSLSGRSKENDSDAIDPASQQALGDFRILRQLGRGGMGVVYEAEQLTLGRRIALKVLPFAAMLDKQQIRRFQNEARAAATLDHPGIVSIHSVGCERGVHYIAMQLIEGQTLQELIRELRQLDRDGTPHEEPLLEASQRANMLSSGSSAPSSMRVATEDWTRAGSVAHGQQVSASAETPIVAQVAISTDRSTKSEAFFRAVADLGIQAAEALQHAHAHGVLHRDIKPGNLMLDTEGKLWITDFGLARIEADPGLTMTGDLVGTLRYMSPEQALAKAVVDQRADVYSLGLSLYELLTFQPAFRGDDREGLLNQIAFTEPPAPCQINNAIPTDLATIVRTAMNKSPEERYTTAQELADDLRHFLNNEPIHAKKPTLVELISKWSRRHRAFVSSTAVILLILSIALTISMVAVSRALLESEASVRWSNDLLYAADVRLAEHALSSANVRQARKRLRRHIPRPGDRDRRGFAWYYLWNQISQEKKSLGSPDDSAILSVDYSPDGSLLATAHDSGKVFLWSAKTGATTGTLAGHSDCVRYVCFSPDGKLLASSGDDGRVILWNVNDRQPLQIIHAHAASAECLAFSPDAQILASCGGKTIKLWSRSQDEPMAILKGHIDTVHAVAFSPDGNWLATAGHDDSVRIWNWKRRALLSNLEHSSPVISVGFSHDGHHLATGTQEGLVSVWNVDTADRVSSWNSHSSNVYSVSFSPDDSRLVSASKDSTVRIRDVASGQELSLLQGHTQRVHAARFSPDDKSIVSCSSDKTVKIWPREEASYRQKDMGEIGKSDLKRSRWAPDASMITMGNSRSWNLLRTDLGQRIRMPILQSGASSCWFRDGRVLVTAGARVVGRLNTEPTAGQRRMIADIDGDGDDDWCASFGRWGHIIWQENLGRKKFAPPKLRVDREDRLAFTQTVDWDGDQTPEILESSAGSGTITLIKGQDSGWGAEFVLRGLARPTAVWPADFDRDGSLDIAVATFVDNSIAWYRNGGDGTPGARKVVSSDMPGACGVMGTDLDGDGWPDLIAAARDGNKVSWFRNLGDGNFSEEIAVDDELPSPGILDMRDVDRDGRDDLMVTAKDCLVWYRNAGDGAFEHSRRVIESLDNARWLRPLESNVVLWDVPTVEPILHFNAHAVEVWDVACSFDSTRLAIAGDDDVVRIWDARDGTFLRSIPEFRDRVEDLAYSRSGRYLAIAVGDHAYVWDEQQLEFCHELVGHDNSVTQVLFSPDDQVLVTLSHDLSIRLWSVTTGELLLVLLGHGSAPKAVCFSSDGKRLVTGDELGMVHIWDRTTGQELLKLDDFAGRITAVAFRGRNLLMAAGSHNKQLRIGAWCAGDIGGLWVDSNDNQPKFFSQLESGGRNAGSESWSAPNTTD